MLLDYSGQNLQGRSFKGQNLTNANFSTADIRGADFTNANLKGANFSGAKAGLQRRWVIRLQIVAFLLSALSGFFLIFSSSVVIFILLYAHELMAGIIVLVMVTVFYILAIYSDLRAGVIAIAGVEAFLVAIFVALAIAGYPVVTKLFSYTLTMAIPIAIVIVVAVVVTIAVALAIAVTESVNVALTGALAGTLAGVGVIVLTLAAFFLPYAEIFYRVLPLVIAVVLVMLINGYIGKRSLTGDKKDSWLRSFAIAFAAITGTSFRGANLTYANFTSATLKNTDFRKANLTNTCFYEAKKLDFARLDNTILTNYRSNTK